MTQLHVRARPARGIYRAGFLLLITCSLWIRGALPVHANDSSTPGESPPVLHSDTPAPIPSLTLTSTLDPETPTATGSISPTEPAVTVPATLEPTAEASATEATAATSSQPPPTDSPVPATSTLTAIPSGTILISEVAWAGTLASAHDEWIELYNPGGAPVDLRGWVLTDHDDIDVQLSLLIAPYSFALLERTDDSSVASIPADQVYTGSLNNAGDSLFLLDPAGGIVDSANADGGSWPAGDSSGRLSMERRGGGDQVGNWGTFAGYGAAGYDSAGNLIRGTPRAVNSIHLPPPASPTTTGTVPAQTPTSLAPTTTQALFYELGALLINEVAWAGTRASASDEWIELFNPGDTAIPLDHWRLTDGGDLTVFLSGLIPAGDYYLLERSDDQAVANISADLIYSGSLSNGGETLRLLDPQSTVIDSANLRGGPWPAGDLGRYATMERRGGDDQPGNWATFTGFHGSGIDAGGNAIQGSPRRINSLFFPTPQPTWIPGKIVINEVLIRPHYDWEGRGGVDTGDEFIELLNLGPSPVNLRDWILDDIEGAGSKPYALPARTLAPGEYSSFFRSRTHIALNDGGDSVRLLAPDGRLIDRLTYLRVRAYNLSFGRLPDGSGHLFYGLWPTPGQPNLLFEEIPLSEDDALLWQCPRSNGFRFALARIGRQPYQVSWLTSRGYRLCWPTE